MKARGLTLDQLQIDGFGHFHEFKIELGPGLNVLYGENEVGKSTLMAFVRSVLFGFARSKSPERYEPIGGKAFGGRVLLTTPHGELWVQRLAGKSAQGELTVKNGVMALVPQEKLNEALAGVDRALFEQVFAFGLDELRSWTQLMDSGKVNEALAAASMQGALRLPLALKRFEPDATGLWGERASTRALNVALAALGQVRARRQQLGDRPREYFAAQSALEQTQREEARLEEALQHAAADEFSLQRLRAAAPHVERAVQAQLELSAVPSGARFPADGLVRLEATLTALQTAEAALAGATGVQSALERQRAGVSAQLQGAAGASQAEPIARALEGWRLVVPLQQQLSARRAEQALKQQRGGEQQQRLGLAGALESVDASAAARARITAARAGVLETTERTARAEEALRLADARAQDVARTLAEREAELGSLGAGSEGLEQTLEAARSLGNLEHQSRIVLAQHEDRQTALNAAEVPEEPAPLEQWPLWLVAPLALGLLLLSGVAWGLAGARAGLAALGFSLALDALLVGLHHKGHRQWLAQKSAWQAVGRHRKEHRERLALELEVARSRFATLRQLIEQTRAIAGVADNDDGTARVAELERLSAQSARRSELLREVSLGRARRASAAEDQQRASAVLETVQAAGLRARQSLDAVLEQLGLPAGLEGTSALELLGEIAVAQTTATTLADSAAELGRDEARVASAAQALAQAAAQVKVPPATPAEQHRALAAWLEKNRALQAEALTLGSRLDDAVTHVGAAQAAAELAAGRLDALLQSAGATDLEQFRRAGVAYETAQRLAGEARQAAASVQVACGLTVELAHLQLLQAPGLEPRLERARTGRLELEAARRVVHEQRGALVQQLRAWETDAGLGALLQQEQALVAQIEALARRVAVARLGQAVLGHAREKFEAEHQPQLVQQAAETFKRLTDGRYPRLVLDAANRALHAVDRQGRVLAPEQLSRGTREQLLTALRLAMITEFGRERLALPLLVDDVLVNFDPRRAERMIAALAELSTRHQVIAFTCHPQLRELFKAHGARAIEVSTRAQLALLPT